MHQRFIISTTTHESETPPEDSPKSKWDVAVVAEKVDIDDRSVAASNFVSANASRTVTVRFDLPTNETLINGKVTTFGGLRAQFSRQKSVLIEATTLSVTEILYVIAAAVKEAVSQLRLVYVEPRGYRRRIEGRLCEHRDFDLSDNRLYRSIPMFRTDLNETSPGRAVFFLGYEGARLGQALEQEEILQRWKKHMVIGVPAFEPGWEIDTIANNIQYFDGQDSVQFTAASSVAGAYNLLCALRHQDKEDKPILVAPLGTKPHAIGAILFLLEFTAMEQAVFLYDHPDRTQGRTDKVRRWHFYDVVDSSSSAL
ncbi:MAG: hypothetical protein HZB95_12235 [Nitrosomonadales bacterium]|nr:hypothetical protein [Nitrosomonadales bacterium]